MKGRTAGILGGAAGLALVATTLLAAPGTLGTPWQRAQVFATCSGRLAAVGTRQHADRNPAWSETLEQREMFERMLEATLPAAIEHGVPDNEPVRWRSAGWVEMAVLLLDMFRNEDPGRAAQARHALEGRVADCTGLLLGS